MAKLFLSELSAVLAEKHGIDRRIAQRFVTSIVAVVQSGIEADRMVKIKGLGTFKIIDVEARESVNVNTGERLVIDSHSKLSFLPDNSMKELVNKPFSQFETVVLKDGVEFNDVAEEDAESPVTEEEEALVEAETVPAIVEEEEIGENTAPTVVEEETPVSVVEQEEKPVETIQKVIDMPEETNNETEETKDTLPPGWKYSDEEYDDYNTEQASGKKQFGWGHLAVSALTALLVGGGIGYFIGHNSGNAVVEEPQPQLAQATTQSTPQTVEEQPAVEEKTETETQTEVDTQPQVEEDSATPIWEKYDAMDTRTRTGYYYITGLDHVIKAKVGDNSTRIARRVFGAAELACYIEVFNDINGSTVLEEDTEVKIPKIESKKAVKKRLEQQNNQQ